MNSPSATEGKQGKSKSFFSEARLMTFRIVDITDNRTTVRENFSNMNWPDARHPALRQARANVMEKR
jgi:hypothetical protein